MLKVRWCVFMKPLRPGDDHRADRVRPHDVGIVVDLDAADRPVDAERHAERRKKLVLARGFRQLARQGLARVGFGMFDNSRFSPRCGRDDVDLAPSARDNAAQISRGPRSPR